ncbi:MAG TPA: hypothetical protein VN709_01855 [Terriglobales bacterium]|nr:hypothetical protein [Terriglobales bacterium]
MFVTITACAVLTLALGWWIFTPTLDRDGLSDDAVQRQALRERKQAVYENLKDLHFEHLAGKLTDADFERTREMLEREAATVVAALEAAPDSNQP